MIFALPALLMFMGVDSNPNNEADGEHYQYQHNDDFRTHKKVSPSFANARRRMKTVHRK
jgi:hypothetical protein